MLKPDGFALCLRGISVLDFPLSSRSPAMHRILIIHCALMTSSSSHTYDPREVQKFLNIGLMSMIPL